MRDEMGGLILILTKLSFPYGQIKNTNLDKFPRDILIARDRGRDGVFDA